MLRVVGAHPLRTGPGESFAAMHHAQTVARPRISSRCSSGVARDGDVGAADEQRVAVDRVVSGDRVCAASRPGRRLERVRDAQACFRSTALRTDVPRVERPLLEVVLRGSEYALCNVQRDDLSFQAVVDAPEQIHRVAIDRIEDDADHRNHGAVSQERERRER